MAKAIVLRLPALLADRVSVCEPIPAADMNFLVAEDMGWGRGPDGRRLPGSCIGFAATLDEAIQIALDFTTGA